MGIMTFAVVVGLTKGIQILMASGGSTNGQKNSSEKPKT